MLGRKSWLLGLALSAVAVAGCGGSSSGSKAAPGSALTVADVAPFTGTDAALGPTYLVSCDAATNAINTAGGVLGHKLNCKAVDTRGDPADAVPAVRQMYASTSNLALVIGCGAPRTKRPRSSRSSAPARRCRSA
jgi:ABC-type branched-subunit amino acid transport system substrate-binding protein